MTGAMRRKTPEALEEKKAKVFHLWDVNGFDFPLSTLRQRVGNINSATVKEWREMYKKEREV